jgi:hypothetical protein
LREISIAENSKILIYFCVLDASQEPYAIDLCVGECSAPGSEWTTTFGILRFISNNEAEIHFDPSGQRPASFDNTEEANIHHLSRKTE